VLRIARVTFIDVGTPYLGISVKAFRASARERTVLLAHRVIAALQIIAIATKNALFSISEIGRLALDAFGFTIDIDSANRVRMANIGIFQGDIAKRPTLPVIQGESEIALAYITGISTPDISAAGIWRTVIGVSRTFVDVATTRAFARGKSVSGKARSAFAAKARILIDAHGGRVASRRVPFTLIDILAATSVAFVSLFTVAGKAADRIGTSRVDATIVLVFLAFVDIFTTLAVALVAGLTLARIFAQQIFANGVFGTAVFFNALVNINARIAISSKTVQTNTDDFSVRIVAGRKSATSRVLAVRFNLAGVLFCLRVRLRLTHFAVFFLDNVGLILRRVLYLPVALVNDTALPCVVDHFVSTLVRASDRNCK